MCNAVEFKFIGTVQIEVGSDFRIYLNKPVDGYAAHLRVDLWLFSIHVVGQCEECLLRAT